jgi:hypothetical protein
LGALSRMLAFNPSSSFGLDEIGGSIRASLP